MKLRPVIAAALLLGGAALLSLAHLSCEHACEAGVDRRCNGKLIELCGGTAQSNWSGASCARPGWPDSTCIDPGHNDPFCSLSSAPVAECNGAERSCFKGYIVNCNETGFPSLHLVNGSGESCTASVGDSGSD